MAQQTLEDILQSVGAFLDEDATTPSGDDLTTRVKYVDMALSEWGNTYQWRQLRISATATFAFSGTSFALPTNFKKLMSPVVDVTEAIDNEYIEIRPDQRFSRASASNLGDRYSYVIGDDAIGRALVISPAIASGASLNYDFQSFPSSMATLSDISVCPHPEFITKRTIALLLEVRSDPRFPQLKIDADTLLSRMVEEEQSASLGENNTTREWAKEADYSVGFD